MNKTKRFLKNHPDYLVKRYGKIAIIIIIYLPIISTDLMEKTSLYGSTTSKGPSLYTIIQRSFNTLVKLLGDQPNRRNNKEKFTRCTTVCPNFFSSPKISLLPIVGSVILDPIYSGLNIQYVI